MVFVFAHVLQCCAHGGMLLPTPLPPLLATTMPRSKLSRLYKELDVLIFMYDLQMERAAPPTPPRRVVANAIRGKSCQDFPRS